ncbi:MAG TPA: nuclear transport factor 2 family protein [Trebonia sp.]
MLDTRGVIDGIFADAATGDLEKVLRWWAEDGILEDVTLARAYRGKQEIRDYLRMYYGALPEVTYEPIRLVVSGPTAVVEWAQSTRVAADFDGVDAAGRDLYLHAIDIFHVENGLIQHEASWYGDAWLRLRLEGVTDPGMPGELPVTPAPVRPGSRF